MPIRRHFGGTFSPEAVETDELVASDSATMTANVPSDYATLQSAVDDLSKQQFPDGTTVQINIDSGHSPAEGVVVSNGFYGHFEITSDDAVVTVDSSFSKEVVECLHGVAPVLKTKFDMQGNGDSGYSVKSGVGFIDSTAQDAGVINAGNHALFNRAGTVFAREADLRGAASMGVRSTLNASTYANAVDASGCSTGLFCSRGANLTAIDATATGCSTRNLRAGRGYCTAEGANLSSSNGTECVLATVGAVLHLKSANCSGSPSGQNVYIQGSIAFGKGVDASGGATTASLRVDDGSAYFPSIDISDGGNGVYTNTGGDVSLINGTADNIGNLVCNISDGSIIKANGITVDGSSLSAGDTSLSSLNAVESDGIVFN